MGQKNLFFLWGGLAVLCAGLGFIPEPVGLLKGAMVLLALLFFAPPAVIMYRAAVAGHRRTVGLIRNLSALWLAVTTALLVANFLSLWGNEFAGDFLYAMLVMVSVPMICGRYWVVSLFCWACLLFAGNHILKTMKTRT